MNNSMAKIDPEETGATESKLASFLADLSDLCRKHGIGITGDATLFVMEPVDYQLNYQIDANSRLFLR